MSAGIFALSAFHVIALRIEMGEGRISIGILHVPRLRRIFSEEYMSSISLRATSAIAYSLEARQVDYIIPAAPSQANYIASSRWFLDTRQNILILLLARARKPIEAAV